MQLKKQMVTQQLCRKAEGKCSLQQCKLVAMQVTPLWFFSMPCN